MQHHRDAVTRPIRTTEWRIDVTMKRRKVAAMADFDGDALGLPGLPIVHQVLLLEMPRFLNVNYLKMLQFFSVKCLKTLKC